ncbi:LPS assembly lipoprotein LptE [Psychrobacter sp. GP33]|uniref:LPS-assembly lipoprotein LptE n=1 Tax=Psychrobacter sp. GP33 TaxID=2758709 RepID=UPI0015FAACA1|nr:LPS assembly lipoprotein LptE [Psychrobacter sp. GP33]
MRANTVARLLLATLPLLTVMGTTSLLAGCGFHLRGYDAPLRFEMAKTAIIIDDNRTSFPLKLPLTQRLKSLGVDVVDSSAIRGSATSAEQIAIINVDNIRFKRYELVGVLTEIRLVISADVTYKTLQDGKPVTLTNPIQVERSYQYNEASVSTDDQQGTQIRDWLYESLARRIADQYVAINLPKKTAATAKSTAPLLKNGVTTRDEAAVIVPSH